MASYRVCVRACVRARMCVRMYVCACACACARACLHACSYGVLPRACVRACMRACVSAPVREFIFRNEHNNPEIYSSIAGRHPHRTLLCIECSAIIWNSIMCLICTRLWILSPNKDGNNNYGGLVYALFV